MLVGVMAMCEASRYTLSRLGGSKPMLGRTFGAGTDHFDSRGYNVILSVSMTVLQCNINTTKNLSDSTELGQSNGCSTLTLSQKLGITFLLNSIQFLPQKKERRGYCIWT